MQKLVSVKPLIHDFLSKTYFGIIERFGKTRISRSYGKNIQADIDRLWRGFTRDHPGRYYLAQGCLISGLNLDLAGGKILFQWRTEFAEGQRNAFDSGGLLSLGYFHAFDLYAKQGSENQATLLAVSPEDTIEWHLHYHHVQKPDACVNEAIKRARAANAFWGSQWAVPAPLGKVATLVFLGD